MTKIRLLPLLVLCLALPLTMARGEETSFDISGQTVKVPAPQGYVMVTERMAALQQVVLNQGMADTANDTLAFYVSEADAALALGGEIPPMERTFALKVNRQIKDKLLSTKDFIQVRELVKKENATALEQAKAHAAESMSNFNQGMSEQFNVDFAMSVSKMVPLPSHHESDNEFSFSMYINYNLEVAGAKEEAIVAATSTFVNVGGKVLFFYCYAPKSDLEWTRASSKAWTDSVLASNTAPPAASVGVPRKGGGFDWKRVAIFAIVGAGIGAAVSLVKKKKAKEVK